MYNFSIVEKLEPENDFATFINSSLCSGFKLFDQYFTDKKSSIPSESRIFFDKLLQHKNNIEVYFSNPDAFRDAQELMYQFIYSSDHTFSEEEKLFFEFMLGLCRFEFCLRMVIDFCEFSQTADKDLIPLFSHLSRPVCECEYCLIKNPFWKSLHALSLLVVSYTSCLIDATDNFQRIDFWMLAFDFFKKDEQQRLLAKYLVSMHFIPKERKILGIAQTLHWGGFGGSGAYIESYPQLVPLLEHRIGYHAKESGGFNQRLRTILLQQKAMSKSLADCIGPLLDVCFSSQSEVKMLDVGSGPSYLGAIPVVDALKKQGNHVELTASDVDPSSISALVAKQQIDDVVTEVRFLDLNLLDEVPDDCVIESYYDIVTACLVLHQLSHPQIFEALSFFVRLLKPGGLIINSDVGTESYYQCLLVPANEVDREGHVVPFKEHRFQESSFSTTRNEFATTKIAYPLRRLVENFPSEQICLYTTVIYQVIEVPCPLVLLLDGLWQKEVYDEADQLVLPFLSAMTAGSDSLDKSMTMGSKP